MTPSRNTAATRGVHALALVLVVASLLACGAPPSTDGPPAEDASTPAPSDGDEADPPAAQDAGAATTSDDAGAPEPASLDAGPPVTPQDAGAPTASSGCGLAPEEGTWTIEHDGSTRTFHVRLPAGYDADVPTPVVVSLHGRAVNASSQELVSGFTSKADAEGFIVVYPEGTGNVPTWNAGLCCGEAMNNDGDDVGLLNAMLDELDARVCVDSARVYANGLSNGGYMAYALACEASDRFAAVASVAGPNLWSPCEPEQPIGVFHFHGTADNIVAYDGNGVSSLSVDGNMSSWADRNGCESAGSVFLEDDDVVCEEWTGCSGGAEVKLCTINGGGHQWPGGGSIPFLGPNTDTIDATDMMWSFFEQHARP
jgi:polyhydroxybutyrate depolymerase